jgi:hypothetical protein
MKTNFDLIKVFASGTVLGLSLYFLGKSIRQYEITYHEDGYNNRKDISKVIFGMSVLFASAFALGYSIKRILS